MPEMSLEQARMFELENLQTHYDLSAAQNLETARRLDRARIMFLASPLAFILGMGITRLKG
jgi:hypothetical protein